MSCSGLLKIYANVEYGWRLVRVDRARDVFGKSLGIDWESSAHSSASSGMRGNWRGSGKTVLRWNIVGAIRGLSFLRDDEDSLRSGAASPVGESIGVKSFCS